MKLFSSLLFSSLLDAQSVGIGVANPAARLHIRVPSGWSLPLLRVDSGTSGITHFIVTPSGEVGVMTSNPQYTLDVAGNARVADSFRIDGDFRPAGDPGQNGQVLTSQGSGMPPTWQPLNSSSQGGSACTFNCPDTLICVDLTGNAISCDSVDNHKMVWASCTRACANSTVGGYGDWRMPTLFEIIDRVKHIDIGSWSLSLNGNDGYIWTATPAGMNGLFAKYGAHYYTWNLWRGWNDYFAYSTAGCGCVR